MPKLSELPLIAMDSEGTGLDHYHGARPYFISLCEEDGTQYHWEWDVDPYNRQPIIPSGDIEEVHSYLKNRRRVSQNPKHDAQAVSVLPGWEQQWPWDLTYCTLLAGHLLSSNTPHDLTTMCLLYLGVNIKPLEDALERCATEARNIVKKQFPKWRRARKGLSDMPSCKGKDKKAEARGTEKTSLWKYDAWMCRALVKEAVHSLKFNLLPEHEQQPTVVKKVEGCDVVIDRTSKWGNPYVIGKDGSREEVVQKYAGYIWKDLGLQAALPELYGKRIGCHCSPELCHGDVLRALCHPYWTVLRDYGNTDTSVLIPLFLKQKQLLVSRGLWKIYLARLKLLPIVTDMEAQGLSCSEERFEELLVKFKEKVDQASRICTNLAASYSYELKLPDGATNKNLRSFLFETLKLPVVELTKKTKEPSDNKRALDKYIAESDEKSKVHIFCKKLRERRQGTTAIGYIGDYQRFWLPLKQPGWKVVHVGYNTTGSDTLRFSSSNPNGQNVSKQEGYNLRYGMGPAPGREWWSCDGKNLELRLPAYEAGEEEMIRIFEKPNDPPYFGSYHLLVFDILHPDKFAKYGPKVKDVYESTWYQWVKNGNFASQYGAIEKDFDSTADRAYHVQGAQRRIKSRLSKIAKLGDYWIEFAERHGYVETMPDKSVDPERGYPLVCTRTDKGRILPTVPLSYHVQGTAMWWMSMAMIRCYARLQEVNRRDPRNFRICAQIHDELIFDFPKGKTPEENLPLVLELQGDMAQGGIDIGVPTPVSRKYHPVSWDAGVAV